MKLLSRQEEDCQEEDSDSEVHFDPTLYSEPAYNFGCSSESETVTPAEAPESPTEKQAITPGMYVKIIKEPFKSFYATVVGSSYGDELEINYFEKKLGGWILKEKDFDSQEEGDLMVVTADINKRGHFSFSQ